MRRVEDGEPGTDSEFDDDIGSVGVPPAGSTVASPGGAGGIGSGERPGKRRAYSKDPSDKIGTDPEFRNSEELDPVADAFDEAYDYPNAPEPVEDEPEEES